MRKTVFLSSLKIYVDISVIGGCLDEEFARWSNGIMEDFKNKVYIPVISEVVETEILAAPDGVKDIFCT